LTGNVRVMEPRFTLNCARMDIRLAETGAADKKQQAAVSEITGLPDFAPGGKKELKSMRCYGGVRLVRKTEPGAAPETAEAQEAQMIYPQQVITMTGRKPTIARGGDTLSGDKLIIDLKSQNLVAEPRSCIVFQNKGKGAGSQRTEVLADRADLGYGRNLLVFTGNVKVKDPRMALDCDRMDIYLKDAAPSAGKTAKKAPDSEMASIAGPDAKKQLEKIICTGKVMAREPRMKMDCDKLTLLFRQVTDPARLAVPGMFQSQGTELVQVLTDGNVVFENIPEKKTASSGKDKSSAAGLPTFDTGKPIRMTADRGLVDLPGNVSEFHGNVRVREDQGQLDCQDLYLYSKGVVPQKVEKTVETRFSGFESLDDDPFAKSVSGVRQVPQVISLGEGRELDRVVALKDVVLVRRLPSGGEQRATGQKAEYFVSRRQVELSGDAPEYAQITDANPQNNGRSRKITVFLDRETVAFDGRVQMEFDAKSGKPGVDL
jgi:lipopolysaccharide export system protein LptA